MKKAFGVLKTQSTIFDVLLDLHLLSGSAYSPLPSSLLLATDQHFVSVQRSTCSCHLGVIFTFTIKFLLIERWKTLLRPNRHPQAPGLCRSFIHRFAISRREGLTRIHLRRLVSSSGSILQQRSWLLSHTTSKNTPTRLKPWLLISPFRYKRSRLVANLDT